MIGVLIGKEFRQHWIWFVLLGLFTWLYVFSACAGYNARGTGAGAFAGVGVGLIVMMPLAAMILGHFLVAKEYRYKTQMFLEGLPFSRWRMISLKLFLAFSLIFIYTAGCLGIGWLYAAGSEMITYQFLGIMLASGFGWAAFCTGFFFAMGFMGRYRMIIFLTLIVTFIVLKSTTSLPLHEFSPYALVDFRRFGLEREIWPVSDLKITGMMIGGWIVLSFFLGLAKEGSIASMLGEKMSYREKMLISSGAVIVILSLVFFSMEQKPKPKPFDIPGAVFEEWEGVEVYFSPEEQGKPVDLEVDLASTLARRLARQRDWLGIEREDFPKIYVVERSDIEMEEKITWEDEEKLEDNVILMYAGYRQPEFSENRLLSWTLSQILRRHSMERVGHENRWWIVCGLEGLWEMEQADDETVKKRIDLAVEAVKKIGLSFDQVIGWSTYQDDADWRAADAVAWMGMKHLEETKGRDAVQSFARDSVIKKVKRSDSRAPLWDYTHSVTAQFKKSTGMDLPSFVADWKNYILSFDREVDESKEGGDDP